MRSEFETNVMHKQIIDRVRFSEKANQYLPVDASFCVDRSCADVVNVGWISYQYQQSKVDELQKRVDALTLALDQIAYPIPHMQKEAELNGCELNGYWAVKMSEDHTYSKDIARRALEKEQALKGGGK